MVAENPCLPRLATFHGIVVWMYCPAHPPPHFHATYGEHGPAARRPSPSRCAQRRRRARGRLLVPCSTGRSASRSVIRTTSGRRASMRRRAPWSCQTDWTRRLSFFTATTSRRGHSLRDPRPPGRSTACLRQGADVVGAKSPLLSSLASIFDSGFDTPELDEPQERWSRRHRRLQPLAKAGAHRSVARDSPTRLQRAPGASLWRRLSSTGFHALAGTG